MFLPLARRGTPLLLAAAFLLTSCSSKRQATPPPPPPPVEFLGEWGTPGDGPGKLMEPGGITTDSTGMVYVADSGSAFIHKFDPQGKPLLSFTHQNLQRPTGIAVDRGGAIYVADYLANRVLIFYPDGSLLREIRGGPGRRFDGPIRVAVDNEGNLFVIEFDAHRVQKFNPRGRFVKAWGKDGMGPGQFHYPVAIAIGPDGNLYVADTHNRRIEKFTRSGAFLAAWGQPGTAPDMMGDITGLAFDGDRMILTDSGNHRLQLWTLGGRHLLTDEGGGRFKSDLQTPADLALGMNRELFVLHTFGPSGPRVLRFRINL